MASGDVQILTQNAADAPLDYLIPAAQEIVPRSVYASFDGSAALAAFLPALQIISPSGHVVATCPAAQVAAGASADVTWFPRVAAAPAGVTVIYDEMFPFGASEVDIPAIPQTFLWLELNIVAQGGNAYGSPPGTVRLTLNGFAVAHTWVIRAAGSHTDLSAHGSESSAAIGFLTPSNLANSGGACYSTIKVRLFNYQSKTDFKQIVFEGGIIDQDYNPGINHNYENNWTGSAMYSATAFAVSSMRIFPNANPSTTSGTPDAGTFTGGTRVQLVGVGGR